MTCVLDASAVLAFLQGEDGADAVERYLDAGARCATVNWSEVAQKVRASDGDWDLARSLLESYGINLEPVLEADAEWAASRWRRGEGLSLADRLCLALAARLAAPAVTADRAWGSGSDVIQIRPS